MKSITSIVFICLVGTLNAQERTDTVKIENLSLAKEDGVYCISVGDNSFHCGNVVNGNKHGEWIEESRFSKYKVIYVNGIAVESWRKVGDEYMIHLYVDTTRELFSIYRWNENGIISSKVTYDIRGRLNEFPLNVSALPLCLDQDKSIIFDYFLFDYQGEPRMELVIRYHGREIERIIFHLNDEASAIDSIADKFISRSLR